jgi:hypothetical protein
MMPQILELDHNTNVAPLGVRFWDTLTDKPISAGLFVSVYAPGDRQRAVTVFPNRSDVFVFQHVNGLRVFESGAGDAAFWLAPQPSKDLVIEVSDAENRFVPFSLRTSAPQRGLLSWPQVSNLSLLTPPMGRTPWVPLFSAATRLVAGGVGVIRAQLWDATQDGPAAWAVFEVDIQDHVTVQSIADARGRVAVLFPYPTPRVEPLGAAGSPVYGPGTSALRDQIWTLTIRARYGQLNPPTGIPDLEDALSQPIALMWGDQARSRLLADAQLQFGKETVLRSLDDSGLTRPSVLLVQAGSPL